jgi:hypothetical protein
MEPAPQGGQCSPQTGEAPRKRRDPNSVVQLHGCDGALQAPGRGRGPVSVSPISLKQKIYASRMHVGAKHKPLYSVKDSLLAVKGYRPQDYEEERSGKREEEEEENAAWQGKD